MRAFILLFLIAVAVTSVSIPWVRQLALALGFVDAPSQRKVHRTPIPLLGGVAIFGGSILVLAIYFRDNAQILGFLGGALIMVMVGLVDDRYELPAALKLGGQLLAFGVVIVFGVTVRLPGPDWLDIVLTIVWLGAITNAVNFLDNMDGLCAGVVGIAAAFIVLMAAQNGQLVIGPMAAAVFGACLGFLRYNFRPASIFMGDAGSLLLGYLLAIMTLQLRFPQNANFVTWMVPVLIAGVPLFDLALVTVSRLRRGVNPLTTAGKDHTSHRLVRLGYGQREAVLVLYLLGGACGMVALFITQADVVDGYLVGGATAVAAAFAIWQLEKHARL